MKKKKTNIFEIINKTFYIVDCDQFIYFPREVRVIGCRAEAFNSEVEIIIENCNGEKEEREIYMEELERFKSFEEAKEYAEKLNKEPQNKLKAEMWNSPETQYALLLHRFRR